MTDVLIDTLFSRYTSPLQSKIEEYSCARCKDPSPILRKFWGKHSARPDNYIIPQHFRCLPADVYKPVHFNEAINNLSKGSLRSSPGLFFRNLGFRTMAEVVADPECVQRFRTRLHHVKQHRGRQREFPPADVFVASCKVKDDAHKLRVAWSFPPIVRVAEQMFAQSILAELPADYILSSETCHDEYCYGGVKLDISQFDAHVPHWLLADALDVVFERFDLKHYKGRGTVKQRDGLLHLVSAIRRYILSCPYRYKRGLYFKHHGIPSGSAFTNILCSVIGEIVLANAHRECRTYSVKTYGDDWVYKCDRCRYPAVERKLREFGFNVKRERSFYGSCLRYCKRICVRGFPLLTTTWINNVFNKIRDVCYWPAIAYMLIVSPDFKFTPVQLRYLRCFDPHPGALPPKLLEMVEGLRDARFAKPPK